MDAHTQVGRMTSYLDRRFEGFPIRHQRGTGHDAVAVSFQNALVDLVSKSKIVRIHNQLLHDL